jgi:hypothetical protein
MGCKLVMLQFTNYDISNNIQYVRDYLVTKIVIEMERYCFRLRIHDDIIQYNIVQI